MNAPVDYHTDLTEEQEVKLSDYLSIVKRRKKPFFLTLGVILALAIGLAMNLPPVYRSSALVLVQQSSMTGDLLDSTLSEQADQSVEYLIRSVVRDETMLKVVRKFDLFPGTKAGSSGDAEFDQVNLEGALIDKMEKAISVKAVNPEVLNTRNRNRVQTQMAFEISFDYPHDPKMAQKVTEEIVTLFMSVNFEKRKELTKETTAFLQAEKDKIEKNVEAVEAKIEIFRGQNNGFLPEQIKTLDRERERTERELLTVEQQLSSVRSSTFQLQGQLAGTKAFIYEDRTLIRNEEGERVLSATGRLQTLQQRYHSLISKYSSSHPEVKKVLNEIISLGGNVDAAGASPLSTDELEIARTQLNEARQKYSDSHPTVQRLETKVSRLESQSTIGQVQSNPKEFNSLKRVNPAFSSLKSGVSRGNAEMESLRQREASLRAKLNEYASRSTSAPGVEREFTRLTRDRDDFLTEIRAIKKKLSSAERAEALESQQKGDRFDLLEAAELPRRPIKPNRPAIVLLGSLLAAGLAFAIVMLLESLDESITSRRALIGITGNQPIGTIPLIYSTSEAASVKRQKSMRWMLMLGALALIGAAAAWWYLNGMPGLPVSELIDATE